MQHGDPALSRTVSADDAVRADDPDRATVVPMRPGAMTVDGVRQLQRSAGNAATVHALQAASLLARDATATKKPPADDALFQGLLSDRVLAINNTYQGIFEEQKRAVEHLKADFEKEDEPGFAETLVRGLVEAALSKGVTAIVGKLFSAIDGAVGEAIAKRAVAGYAGYIPPGLTAADLVSGDIEGAKSAAQWLSNKAQNFITGKITDNVPKAMDAIAGSESLTTRFCEGQLQTIITTKNDSQAELTDTIAPALRTREQTQALLMAGAILEGLRKARDDAYGLQFLSSVGTWARALQTGADEPDILLKGGLVGKLNIDVAVTDTDVILKGARLEDMDADVLARIHTTGALSKRKIRDLPCQKVLSTGGAPWMVQHADGKIDRTMPAPVYWAQNKHQLQPSPMAEDITSSLLFHEVEERTLGELGEILHGSGRTWFSD